MLKDISEEQDSGNQSLDNSARTTGPPSKVASSLTIRACVAPNLEEEASAETKINPEI